MRLLPIICLFIIACSNPDQATTTDKANEMEENMVDSSLSINKEEDNIDDERSNWQKPDYIIKSLGNLEGKTIADIGSGPLGYFVFKLLGQTDVSKVIAIDIDKEAIGMLNVLKNALSTDKSERLDVRLAEANNPKLDKEETDIILIVNTIAYFPDRLNYLKNLKESLKPGGQLIIIDFKMKRIPDYVEAPPYNSRTYLNIIEEELYAAGYNNITTNDTSLEYQYLISAEK